jgi:hypothetical protein
MALRPGIASKHESFVGPIVNLANIRADTPIRTRTPFWTDKVALPRTVQPFRYLLLNSETIPHWMHSRARPCTWNLSNLCELSRFFRAEIGCRRSKFVHVMSNIAYSEVLEGVVRLDLAMEPGNS